MKNNQSAYILKNAVTSDDTELPAITTGQDLGDSENAEVEVILSGTSPTATITMLLADFSGAVYIPVTPITLTKSEKFDLKVNYNKDVNVFVEGISGSVSVNIKPK